MTPATPVRPRVFVDADVLFAGAAAPQEHGASLVILRLAEVTLIEAITSEQVIVEAERNLQTKMPATLPTFQYLVRRSLKVIAAPTTQELASFHGLAHPKDAPILAAAVLAGCHWLVTFNTRDYDPGHPQITVLRPGELLLQVREILSGLSPIDSARFRATHQP
jgi:predicted nucleic acid-binding protein